MINSSSPPSSLLRFLLPTPKPDASPTSIIHLYRALLRATTYLPDAHSRSYCRNHIIARFAAHKRRTSQQNLLPQRVKKAQKTLGVLVGAAQGNAQSLEKVLMLSHGRQGSRKRGLITALLQTAESDTPKNDELLAKQLEVVINSPNQAMDEFYHPPEKFYRFIESQQQNNGSLAGNAPRPRMKKTRFTPPPLNSWGRPLPLKLKASMRKKWWAETLDKILPPIPQAEWEDLKARAQGRDFGEVPRRSAEAGGFLGSEKSRRRSIRRVYEKIWGLCAYMVPNEDRPGQWLVSWGKNLATGMVMKPAHADKELFEGLDAVEENKAGALSRGKQKRANNAKRVAQAV